MNQLQAQKATVLLVPQVVAGAGSVTANLDCIGQKAVDVSVVIGTQVNTNAVQPNVKLSESDDTVVSNFADVSGLSTTALAASGSVRFNVDLRKRKRYLKLTVTAGTATNDDIKVAALAAFDRSEEFPESTATGEMGNTVVKIG